MKLTGKNIIRRINTITHDGKVLIFGTSAKGKLYYSIKRSGFEDPALKEGADPFGFETWQELRLGESVLDSSVVAWEKANLAEHDGTVLVRSVYGDGADATTSVDAPVQLVSAQGHLYVFRQAPSGKILVNRFVLDGMTNQLVPKLEVRFRRSRERLTPHKPAKSDKSGKKFGGFDSLDYRDIDGKSFFEPALELGFAGTVKKGWFSVVLAPTSDDDRGRWHLFVCDAGSNKLVLYTVGSGSDGLFDVKDYLYGQSDPANREQTQYRSIPGIIRRDFDLTGLVIAGAPSATRYDLQSEQITDAGPQLIRDAMQVMLAVPVTADSDDAAKIKTAALNFALAADGSLSQIDTTPDSSKILRSETRDVITPLTLLDDIKEFAAQEKPQSGTIVATERGADDQLQVVCKEAFENDALSAGNQVEIRGTRSYDGLYKVRSVDGKTFSVDAAFQDNEMGSYEVVPEKRTGLVFDNMIVGCERTDDGKLKIHCAAHDLREYDEVQISGTRAYDGIFPVASTDPDNKSFVLEVPYFTGEAANLAKVVRRGLHMDGNDRVVTPDLDLAPPSHARSMGRTLSAWVRVDGAGNMDQNLIANGGGLMRLILRKDQKVSLWVQMSDDYHTVCDFNALDADTWTHYAATVKYDAGTGKTTIALVRDGVEVSSPTVVYGSPGHLGDQMIQFHGRDDRVEIEAAPDLTNKSFSVELWAKRDGIGIKQQVLVYQGKGSTDKNLQLGFRPIEQSSAFFFGFYNDDADTDPSQTAPDTDWHHYACTYDATTKTQRIYRDGSLAKHRKAAGHYKVDNPPAALILGHGDPGKTDHWSFHGNLSDVRLWNKALSQDAIIQNMSRRLSGHETGLLGYWPLDDGSAKDLSQNNNDGVLKGSAAWIKAPCPQAIGNPDSPIAPPVRGMHFDGVRDYITVPGFSIPNKFTISLWATSDTMDWRSGSTVWSAYSVEPLGDFSRRYNFFLGADDNNTSQRISFLGRSAMAFDEHPPTLETGGSPADITNWHHYATTVQFDSNQNKTTFRFFIDGEKVEEKSRDDLSLPDKLDSMVIGASASDGGLAGPIIRDYFAGFIADVQVWDSARSEAEIKAGMFQKLSGDEDGLV
ncbi:MAG: LamG-like jellyroll fold domain-containing protein, partial [Gammaproteobacteria bacterium]